jgi:arabinogalactan oligomer / maltooligosaccharide transport system permease protein
MKQSTSLSGIGLRLGLVAVIDAVAIWFIYQSLTLGGNPYIAGMVGFIAIGLTIILLTEKLYALRWFAPGLALMFLLVVYPVIFTTYTAFTNYGTGNLLTKSQSISQLQRLSFVPEGAGAYGWTAFRSDDGEFILWVQSKISDETILVGREVEILPEEIGIGPLDENGIPESIPGYTRLPRAQTLRYLSELNNIAFGDADDAIRVQDMNTAAKAIPRYVYDSAQDVIIAQQTGTVYTPQNGRFTSPAGEQLIPGYFITIGWDNFTRLYASPALRGPFLRVFIWTFVFAAMIVLITFVAGLALAIVFNDPSLPGRKIIQSAMVVPYAVPAFISVQVWRGLLNPSFGVISNTINDWFGWVPQWFADPTWAKIGVLFVGLWLGFPYMFLICTGALQSIPSDIYEAAEVDGASSWQRFMNITLPLLLVAVGPLLIGSFAFNFNNFTIIDIYNEGGPPIPGSPTPAGHTDILITYIFRLAFGGGRGVDYGYASAITIVIFIILAIIVSLQFRYTRVWEEVSESV